MMCVWLIHILLSDHRRADGEFISYMRLSKSLVYLFSGIPFSSILPLHISFKSRSKMTFTYRSYHTHTCPNARRRKFLVISKFHSVFIIVETVAKVVLICFRIILFEHNKHWRRPLIITNERCTVAIQINVNGNFTTAENGTSEKSDQCNNCTENVQRTPLKTILYRTFSSQRKLTTTANRLV